MNRPPTNDMSPCFDEQYPTKGRRNRPYGEIVSYAVNRTICRAFRRRAYASLREAIRKRMRGTAKRWKEPARRKIKSFFIVTHSPPPACGGSPLPEGASRQGSAAPITSARVDTITVGAIHESPASERNTTPFRRATEGRPYGEIVSCAVTRTKCGIVSAACLCLPPGGRGTAKRWKEPARRKIKGIFIVTHSPPPACGGSPLPEGASRQGSTAPKPPIRVDTITVGAIHESPASERNAAPFRRREQAPALRRYVQ